MFVWLFIALPILLAGLSLVFTITYRVYMKEYRMSEGVLMATKCEICGIELGSPFSRLAYRDKNGKWHAVCAGHSGTKEYSDWVSKYILKELKENEGNN
jgi:hypothetical protein